MLTNPAYVGFATYNRRESVAPNRPRRPGAYRRNPKSSCRTRPRAEWLHVPIPALVDESAQRDVRVILKSHKLLSMRNTQHEYLLRTLVVCGECGWRMECSHQTQRAGCAYEYFYYNCRHADPLETGHVWVPEILPSFFRKLWPVVARDLRRGQCPSDGSAGRGRRG